MAEENGNGKEIGKLIGSLQALDKGQDALFKEVSEIQAGISDIKQKGVFLDTEIKRNKEDLNGLGKKAECVKEEIQHDLKNYRREIDLRFDDEAKDLGGKLVRQTTIIISVLALFMTFLTIWVYVLKPSIKVVDVPRDQVGTARYETQKR